MNCSLLLLLSFCSSWNQVALRPPLSLQSYLWSLLCNPLTLLGLGQKRWVFMLSLTSAFQIIPLSSFLNKLPVRWCHHIPPLCWIHGAMPGSFFLKPPRLEFLSHWPVMIPSDSLPHLGDSCDTRPQFLDLLMCKQSCPLTYCSHSLPQSISCPRTHQHSHDSPSIISTSSTPHPSITTPSFQVAPSSTPTPKILWPPPGITSHSDLNLLS